MNKHSKLPSIMIAQLSCIGFCTTEARVNPELVADLAPASEGKVKDGLHYSYWRILSAGKANAGTILGAVLLDFGHEGGRAIQQAQAQGLFDGLMLTTDHSRSVGDWVGLVKKTKWNPGNVDTNDPPGIDAQFAIDLEKDKASGRYLARGVDLGAVSKASSSLRFRWDKSHPKMNDREFMDKQGQTVDGSVVRVLVSEVLETNEVSLVWKGADPTAKKRAKANLEFDSDTDLEQGEDEMNFAEFAKALKEAFNLQEDPTEDTLTTVLQEVKKNLSTERITKLTTDLTAAQTKITEHEATIEAQAAEINTLKPMATIGETHLKALREDAKKFLNLATDNKADATLVSLIEKADHPTAVALRDQYFQQANEKAGPLVFNGKEYVRQSSKPTDPPGTAPVTDGVKAKETKKFVKDLISD